MPGWYCSLAGDGDGLLWLLGLGFFPQDWLLGLELWARGVLEVRSGVSSSLLGCVGLVLLGIASEARTSWEIPWGSSEIPQGHTFEP